MTHNPHLAIRVDGFRFLFENLLSVKKTSVPKTVVCVFTAFDLALPQLTRLSGACSFLGFLRCFFGGGGAVVLLFEKTKVTHGIFGIQVSFKTSGFP